MIIATAYENGNIAQHFGHTDAFKFYNVEDHKIVSSEVKQPIGYAHGTLPTFLKENGATTLICGGLGDAARVYIAENGIDLYPGAVGDSDKAVESFLADNLDYNPDFHCSGHEHDEDECTNK
ncbi:MAG: dinitrogenase iron-molybdenum cofactor biosynthesis protein [Sphaerochaetaceae bacterium]|nr:dinitrogenase iron-molybdenum cofactor biosynthesis protein [Sphaerochaetaceae bacterium]